MKILFNQVSRSILDVKKDKRSECYNFGIDNAFPSLIEALIGMSVTSKTCVDRVTKAIYGGSFGKDGEVVVNAKGETLNEVLRVSSREYAKHNNCYLQIGYDGNLDYKSIVVIPNTSSRVGKSDDKGYSGKFLIYDNWDKMKGKRIVSKEFTEVHRFSKNKEIARKQIELLPSIEDYNGQIIHVKKDTVYVYSLTDLYPVMSEALLEDNSQTFRSKGAVKGFLNTKLLTVQPFKDDQERKDFKDNLNDFRGVEESSEVLVLESSQQMDDIEKSINIDDLSSPYNDKLFEYSDTQGEKNICKAFSVPLILVSPSDSSLFGNSGALIREAKKQLYESREEDRHQLEEVFSYIMGNFKKPISDLEIINPYEEEIEELEEEAPDAANKKAQATLRGSVGGVTALLAIQQSVAAGTTTRDSGVSMIVNIYGFDEETAAEMLGDPEPIKKEENE